MKTQKHRFHSKTYNIFVQVFISLDEVKFILDNFTEDNVRDPDKNEIKKRIGKAMKEGKFCEKSGNVIRFNVRGQLIDGYHRLSSSLEAGIAYCWDVVVGIEIEDQIHIGNEKPRTVSQLWAASLGLNRTNTPETFQKSPPIVRLLMRFFSNWANLRLSATEMLDFFFAHENEITPFLGRTVQKFANQVGVRAALSFYYSINPLKAAKLWEKVSGEGDGLEKGSPALMLRNYLAFDKIRDCHPAKRQEYDFGYTLHACWLTETGETTKSLAQKMTWE